MRNPWLIGAGMALTGLVTGSCGSGSEPHDSVDRGTTMAPGETTPAAVYDTHGQTIGQQALLRGKLVLQEGCLYIQDSGDQLLPIFPAHLTSWNDGQLRLSGRTYSPGDRVKLGGGQHDGLGPDLKRDAVIPTTCNTDGYIWIVHPLG